MTLRTRRNLLLALLGIALLAVCAALSIQADLQLLSRGEYPEVWR